MKGRAIPQQPDAGPSDAPRFFARRPFDYAGAALDRGQILRLQGARNDEKLTRLGYVAAVESDATTYTCAECGATFIDIATRSGHGQTRHRARPLTPGEEDAHEERQEALLAQVAPLYLDKAAGAAT